MTRAAHLVLAALLFAVVAVCVLTLAAMGGCLRAPYPTKGNRHEAPRVTPGPGAGSAGSRTHNSFVTEAARRMTPARAARSSSHMAVEAVVAVDRAAAKSGSNPAEDAFDNQPTENKWNIKNQASAASSTTTRAPTKQSRGRLSSRKCTAIFASTSLASMMAEPSSVSRALRTAKSPACRVAGFGLRGSEAMGEELRPIDWWVWLLADSTKRAKVVAETRLLALRKGVLALGVPLDKLDTEVVRA